jgi:hypothetical protein
MERVAKQYRHYRPEIDDRGMCTSRFLLDPPPLLSFVKKLYTTLMENSREIEKKNYTRVTQVLWPFSGLQHIKPEVLDHAAKRGTKVHKICEGIISGLGELGVDDETRGYVESFKLWWATGIDVVELEIRFWDADLLLTGQADLIIRTPKGLAIVDFKTSSKPSKTWEAQGSAYAYLARKAGYDIQTIIFLHLNKHGKPPTLYEYPVDNSFFLSIYRTFKHFFYKE